MNRNKKVLTLSIVVVLMLSLSILGAVSFDNVAQSESPAAENAEKVELADLPQIDENDAPAAAEEPVVQVASAKTDGAVTTTTETTTTTTVPEKNEYINENGEVEIPYDQAFPEEFESGKVEYSDEAIMVKFDDSFNGKVNGDLKKAGIAKVELMFELEDSAWYTATLKKGADVKETMAQVRELDDVVVAEYDFTYETSSIGEPQEISDKVTGNSGVSEQWYLKYCGIQNFWKRPEAVTGEGTVVAVIDTGVDYDHIDLKANMWKNAAETPDNGVDDDNNGYVDDYYGVDVIAGKGNGDDDHGHGTHVAGIIAAANNKEGGVGIAYDSKIMAVKAGMSSGFFNQSDIAEAIIYAYENGADVINMSFGGYASSVAVQDALIVAYTRCVLVAAAGNDGIPNEPIVGWAGRVDQSYPAALTYVLGVMSVGSNGNESGFTNWDVESFNSIEYELYAPGEEIFSTIPNDKYAKWDGTSMAAPVVSAIAANLRSAYPDRNTYPTKFIYGQLASTSEINAYCNGMHPGHNLPQIVDAEAAMEKLPKPNVNMVDYALFDTEGLAQDNAGKNNGDGVVDAGETIALGLTLRNQWGMSKDTVVKIDAISPGGVACPYVTIHNDTVNYGGVGTYSTKDCGKVIENDMHTAWEDPFYITISPDCPNDYIITLNVTVTCKNGLDENDTTVYDNGEPQKIYLMVRRGTVLPNKITEDMTLTAENYYIIPNATLIAEGATVKVEPGTQIQFWSDDPDDPYAEDYIAYLQVEGTLLMDGKDDNHIKLFPSELMADYRVEVNHVGSGYVRMKHCDVINPYISIDYAYGCDFTQNYALELLYYRDIYNGSVVNNRLSGLISSDIADHCSFYSLGEYYYGIKIRGNSYKNCIFVDSIVDSSYFPKMSDTVFYSKPNSEKVDSTKGNILLGKGLINKSNSGSYNKTSLGDSTYVQLSISDLDNYMIDFAEYLGGYVPCIETEEELSRLKTSEVLLSISPIGLKKDPTEPNKWGWINGSPLGEWFSFKLEDGSGGTVLTLACSQIQEISFPYNRGDLFIEFDKDISSVPSSKDELYLKWKEFIASGAHSIFRNNAILNRLPDTNMDNWIRFVAPESKNHDVIGLQGNYWGTDNETLIQKQIYDFDDNMQYADIDHSGYLTKAPENVWPFVVDAGLMDEDGNETVIVGNETVTFYVDFNRDMDTSIPLSVRFGSYYPYADYQVEGEYVSPRRWEGTMTLTTLIENGTQYFNISNGACIPKEGEPTMELFTDWGRFTFEIDTTEAFAMNLQAHATDTGIELTWFQDDFDTLAGYNVYRSTSEDGFYQKLNATMIPADTKTFFDENVEPGVVYYYNFTVVKTDLTESVPSGKRVIMAKDTMAPDMYHTPVYQAFTGSHIVVNAMVTDNVSVHDVKLYWRTVGDEEYTEVAMDKLNDKYSAVIPEAMVTTAGIEYYIAAFDGNTYTYKGSADAPYLITVLAAVDENAKGDVNGDGQITNKDAVILLQGINDLYNLSAEEFARADINSDSVLNAAEALRILKYVSGEISSILF